MNATDWLLDSDPAIRWQAMQDLCDASKESVAAERARVSREGIGAKILASQSPDGAWHRSDEPDWLPTLFSMQLLRATGADRTDPSVHAVMTRLQQGFRWSEEFGAKAFSEGEVEPCINGNALASSSYFGYASDSLATRLLADQLADGGWNCEAPKSKVSSFHSTICVLEGLLEYERSAGFSPEITAARQRAEEYLLARALFRRLSTGELASPEFVQFTFPPRYRYDVLRGLDYFRSAGVTPDTRVQDALDIVARKEQADGRWLLDGTCNEALPFPFHENVGQPSRWNTLRSLRVLRWAGRKCA
jgi:hypothetical protein